MKKNIIKHFIILFNIAVLVCGALFGGCIPWQNTGFTKSCADYKAEWYNDELSFTTTGDRQDSMRYGTMVVNGERIEVIIDIGYTTPGFVIYAKSDFDGLEYTKYTLMKVKRENNISSLYIIHTRVHNDSIQATIYVDNASERYGLPNREDEKFELYRRDLTDEELAPSAKLATELGA